MKALICIECGKPIRRAPSSRRTDGPVHEVCPTDDPRTGVWEAIRPTAEGGVPPESKKADDP